MRAIDIQAAFLQAEPLKREVFIQPPKDISQEGKIWRLLKPIYGLDDASRRFWLTVKRIFKEEGMSNLTGDEAFYHKREGESLIGIVLTHLDDFLVSGTAQFIDSLTERIKNNLTISKVEDDNFRFTCIDITQKDKNAAFSMEDYA